MVRKSSETNPRRHGASLTAKGVLQGMGRLFPLSVFVVPFGIAFGIAATEQGLGPVQATVMSALVFTATAQFAALEFLGEPVAFLSLGLVVLALSGRHIVMGAALSTWVNQLPIGSRLATLALLTDASFAHCQTLLRRGDGDLGPLLGGGLMLWLAWVASTAAGAFGGDLVGDTEAYGFGVVMLCFFAATVFGVLRDSTSLVPSAIVAMGVSASTISILPTGWNIILAALVGGVVCLFVHAD